MRENRGTVARLAEGVAAAARRRQQERSPRVVLYDELGHPRVLARTAAAHAGVVAAATALVEQGRGVEGPAGARGEPGDTH